MESQDNITPQRAIELVNILARRYDDAEPVEALCELILTIADLESAYDAVAITRARFASEALGHALRFTRDGHAHFSDYLSRSNHLLGKVTRVAKPPKGSGGSH